MNSQRAILSNESNYTVFRVGDKVIRFRAPYSLEHYTEVKEWNHGYIVAMAKYKQNDRPEGWTMLRYRVFWSSKSVGYRRDCNSTLSL